MKKNRNKKLKYHEREIFKIRFYYTLTVITIFFAFAYPILFIPGIIFFIIAGWKDTSGHWGERHRLRSGNKGMEKTTELLKKLPKEYSIYEYVTAEKDGRSTVIDFVVVGKSGIFLIDAVNIGGDIIGTEDSPTWKAGVSRIKNPIKKTKWQVHILSNHMKNNGIKNYITGVVYVVGQIDIIDDWFDSGDYPLFDKVTTKQFLDFIKNNKTKLSDTQLKKINDWLKEQGTKVR